MTVDSHILRALRDAGDDMVSGADLAAQLGMSRAAVWARVETLRELGYDIEASPHHGYRLLGSPEALHADDIHSRLGSKRVVGREIQVFKQTQSTNDLADRLARDGVAEGAVVFAEAQTAGRGRLGREWHSPPGLGLWFSVVLRPALHPQAATRITIAAAVALLHAVEQTTGLRPSIKWPNDLMLRGKKVAGILTEMKAEPDAIKYAILGVGLNVNHQARDFPPDLRGQATSLRIEFGQAVDRSGLAAAALQCLEKEMSRLPDGLFESMADEWESHCATVGQPVGIRVGPRVVQGRAEALDANGALLVRSVHGHLEAITGGDVVVEKC